MRISKLLTNLTKWIGIVNGALAIIFGGISVYEKSKLILILIIIFSFLAILAFLIYYIALWKTSEKEKNSKIRILEKTLQEKENENRALRKKMCQGCKKIYSYVYPDDEWVSLNENPNKDERFFPIEKMSDKEGMVYHLDKYIFVDFPFEGEGGECYLISLIRGTIYLPVDKWKETEEDDLLVYRLLCSKRTSHFSDFGQLL